MIFVFCFNRQQQFPLLHVFRRATTFQQQRKDLRSISDLRSDVFCHGRLFIRQTSSRINNFEARREKPQEPERSIDGVPHVVPTAVATLNAFPHVYRCIARLTLDERGRGCLLSSSPTLPSWTIISSTKLAMVVVRMSTLLRNVRETSCWAKSGPTATVHKLGRKPSYVEHTFT